MDKNLITEQTAQLLAEKLPATEHAAFIAWIRPLLGHTDSSKLALDSDWCRGALAGWAARSIYGTATPISAQCIVPDSVYLGCARMGLAGSSDEEVLNYVRIAQRRALAPTPPADGQAQPHDETQPVQPLMRDMLTFVLWHHQGGSSKIGQPIRKMLGMDQHGRMTKAQYETARRVQKLIAQPAESGELVDAAELRSRIHGAIADVSHLAPEDDETWDEWYSAAFDLLGERVGKILDRYAIPIAAQPDLAFTEAASLATSIWKNHYQEDAPHWQLCDNTAGIISQIDNMVTGLVKRPAQPDPEKAGNSSLSCDDEVFKNGISVGLFDIPKDRAEALCKALTATLGIKIDWHYIAGRVHIKALRAQPATGEDDPLQGAANWLLKALSKCDVDDIQCQLIIGYNRAKRLLDAAMQQGGSNAP